ncbi:hypothetical protein HK097_001692 [Rhizophlyctis rosea]|uniref:Pyruvate kinase n=1 Tax=Rhizophlyctis rosea TaxID=64517 RepID=A0AAD5SC33_9FUNG|nr:hypothetical protein HK097_001692 [Rhizophlyctis rosea]
MPSGHPAPSLGQAGSEEAIAKQRKPLRSRRTKIVGTLGPASVPKIRELILAGVNMFRLNFSHIKDPETQTPIIEEIRRHSKQLGIPVAILGDLGGPKIRCNTFQPTETITLDPSKPVRLRASDEPGTDGLITTSIRTVIKQLDPGHRVLLDDGNLILRVKSRISDEELELEVLTGGVLKSRKGINVPDVQLDVPALTDKDAVDARYMFRQRLEYIALSFVQKDQDVRDLLEVFEDCKEKEGLEHKTGSNEDLNEPDALEPGWRPHIILKIETPHSLENIDSLIEISDGIMVARGDLGVEVSLERVPVIQKMLIRKTNSANKPVITATQMLESMINSPVPTRAEVSDVANAVLDGTDAVMLSAECATGKYPVETVKMMGSICKTAEDGEGYMQPKRLGHVYTVVAGKREFSEPIADAAVAASEEADAAALITITVTGEMASYVSKRRPNRPILAITSSYSVWRRLVLLYGVYPILTSSTKSKHITSPTASRSATSPDKFAPIGRPASPGLGGIVTNTDQIYAQTEVDISASDVNKALGIQQGDKVVFCAGYHMPWPGLSNSVKMARFGDASRVVKVRGLWGEALEKAGKKGSPIKSELP